MFALACLSIHPSAEVPQKCYSTSTPQRAVLRLCLLQAHIDLAAVQTNIVCFRVASPLSPQSLLAHLAANRIQALAFRGGVRMVTHLDVSAEDVSKALAVLSSAQAQANGLQESAKVQAAPSADGAVANGHSNKPAYKEY